MPKYMILFEAVPSNWPTDPKQLLALWEKMISGGDAFLKGGQLKEVGWFTNTRGYAMMDADSKDKVLEMVNVFFPFFTQEVLEIVPWEKAKESLLGSARTAAGGGAGVA
jgi:hypothetical protein